MNHQDTLFYIVVPVYKAELFLEQCINSVLHQTYIYWQLILVDDGSPDRSGEMCDGFALKDERIHVIHQKNQGQIAARTAGNQYILNHKVDCSYVVYLDSDDTLELCALERLSECIKSSKAEIVVYDWQRVENGRIKKTNEKKYKGLIVDKRDLYKIVYSNPFYNSLCIKTISTSLIDEEHYEEYFYIRHAEDLLQSINYFKKCNSVLFIDDVLYNYTTNVNSVTQTIRYENYQVDTTVRRIVWDFLKKEDVWSEDDFKKYALSQISSLKSSVNLICGLKTSYRNRIELLRKLRGDKYYKMIMAYGNNDLIIKLLKNGYFRVLLVLCSIYSFCLRKNDKQ